MALSHLPVIPLSSSIPSMNMLLPRETISASKPQAIAPENAWPTDTRQAMLPIGSSARPQPAINRPHRVAGRVGNPRIERARHQLAGVLQRQLGRQRQQIHRPNHPERDRQRQPVQLPEQRRNRRRHGRPAAASAACARHAPNSLVSSYAVLTSIDTIPGPIRAKPDEISLCWSDTAQPRSDSQVNRLQVIGLLEGRRMVRRMARGSQFLERAAGLHGGLADGLKELLRGHMCRTGTGDQNPARRKMLDARRRQPPIRANCAQAARFPASPAKAGPG